MTERQQCEAGKFQCATTGYCIDESLKCDGRAACEDASDEANCRKFLLRATFSEEKFENFLKILWAISSINAELVITNLNSFCILLLTF